MDDEFEQEYLLRSVNDQSGFESGKEVDNRKKNGVYYTNCLDVVDTVLGHLISDKDLINKTVLEPSCGNGIFIQKILIKLIKQGYSEKEINKYISTKLIINDIDPEAIAQTKNKIIELYQLFYGAEYKGDFLALNIDFTKVLDDENALSKFLGKIDYVVGNPPFVALYGRRDKKKTEELREYYLANYDQFPKSVKNGKLNLAMMFIENGLKLLKDKSELSYVLDVSLFETAFKHTRKYLLENTFITELHPNIKAFDVASGQVVLKLKNQKKINPKVLIKDHSNQKQVFVDQNEWIGAGGEYKFFYYLDKEVSSILSKVNSKNDPTLKELYPNKNLRTCCMLLDMEPLFTSEKKIRGQINLKYYEGGKSLKKKFGDLTFKKYFQYDKLKQDKINDELKEKLAREGIKNKKRIGLGEIVVYQNPKIFIRQSAKEIIATYTEYDSAANNSLYVFTLRDSSAESITFLKFLCGHMNSSLVTFYSQVERIVRYSKGKQPQIKTGDLYQIPIPSDKNVVKKIAKLVDDFYGETKKDESKLITKIDSLIAEYYSLDESELEFIYKYSQDYLLS